MILKEINRKIKKVKKKWSSGYSNKYVKENTNKINNWIGMSYNSEEIATDNKIEKRKRHKNRTKARKRL